MKELITREAFFTGTQVNYYIVCSTKLWLFSHFATMEQNSDLVALGQILQETSFQQDKKDLIIDQIIAVDFIRKGNRLIIHEVKKSSKLEKAHITQLAYYLYYLKKEKGIENVEGIINYPSKRKIVEVRLTPEKEAELQNIFQKIKEIISLPQPPKPEKKKYCRKCSYFEFCWI
ncbi:MAG: CRISPR-associated protein Cas4 [Candidatus Aenigmatarchaeota archaeon]